MLDQGLKGADWTGQKRIGNGERRKDRNLDHIPLPLLASQLEGVSIFPTKHVFIFIHPLIHSPIHLVDQSFSKYLCGGFYGDSLYP